MKKLFISQLDALATTMDEAAADSFSMQSYYSSNECGYVACVCGEQALSGRLEFFPEAAALPKPFFTLASVAGFIDDELKAACYTVTGQYSLAQSVTLSGMLLRKNSADRTGLLTTEQLKHPHLNSNSSPEHAASYIRMLIEIFTCNY